MSQTAVEQVIGKIFLDAEFRQRLGSDMQQALAGYDLSDTEIQGLKNIDIHEFDKTVAGLD
jgi:hypothetical protein